MIMLRTMMLRMMTLTIMSLGKNRGAGVVYHLSLFTCC